MFTFPLGEFSVCLEILAIHSRSIELHVIFFETSEEANANNNKNKQHTKK